MEIKPLNIEKHFEHIISVLIEYAPKVIWAAIVLIIGLWLIQRLSILATRSMEKRELDYSLRTFLKSLISIGLKLILIVTVAGMIGIGTTSFVTILGAAGLAVGLALQGSLSNFAGGVLILIFKPYKVNDSVEVLGQIGTVIEIQIFNTILLTADLKTIILPNGAVSNGTIINFTKNGSLRADVLVAISNENDLTYVKRIIIDELLKNNLVLKEPSPKIMAQSINDDSITVSIRSYSKPGDMYEVNSATIEIIKQLMNEDKLKMPTQQLIVYNEQR